MIKGSMKTIVLLNLEERMGHMEKMMEENMKIIANLIQNSRENLPTGDDMFQGTQEDKVSVHVEKPSMDKNIPRGIDSNNGSNYGWSP